MNNSEPKNDPIEAFYTPQELAGRLRLRVARVRDLLRANPDLMVQRFGRTIRIPVETVTALLARYRANAIGVPPMAQPMASTASIKARLCQQLRAETASLKRLTKAILTQNSGSAWLLRAKGRA